MRAVNLIPPEDRRGSRAPARAGLLSYFVIGGLLAVLVAVTSLVLTSTSISDKKAEIAGLEQARAEAQARADSLQAFAEFGGMQQERTATVTTLAQSRFDWERVLRELSLVLPEDVWLTALTGTVSPAVTMESGAALSLRQTVPGPALEIVGCTVSQEAVGSFVAALRDIDGVTRVAVSRSELPDAAATSTETTSGSGEEGEDCRTEDFIARFEILAAFDEVPVAAATPVPGAPAPTAPVDGSVEEGAQEAQQAAEIVP